MNTNLKLVVVDNKYCDYLRKFDKRVPYNFSKKENRPFVGVLFNIDKVKYFAPLSSPKEKHRIMRNMVDFLKLDDGKLGVVNFNNMIPVLEENFRLIELDKINETFGFKYNKLLKEQIYWLIRNDDKLYKKSKKLYNDYINKRLNKKISSRCCNFKLLEEKCIEYNKELTHS